MNYSLNRIEYWITYFVNTHSVNHLMCEVFILAHNTENYQRCQILM